MKMIKMLLQISLCWKEKSSEINKRAALLLGTPEYIMSQKFLGVLGICDTRSNKTPDSEQARYYTQLCPDIKWVVTYPSSPTPLYDKMGCRKFRVELKYLQNYEKVNISLVRLHISDQDLQIFYAALQANLSRA